MDAFDSPVNVFVAVLAGGILSGCGGPVAPTLLPPPELPEVIEALFLGSGPLAVGDCVIPGVFASYAPQSSVTLVLGSTIDDAGLGTLQQAVSDVHDVIFGRFRLVIERSSEDDPTPGVRQITSADVPSARVLSTCSPGGSGCVRVLRREGPILISVQAIQLLGSSQRLKVHEFGHAIGLCHVNADRVPSAVMAPGSIGEGRFSDIEFQALRAVYGSALAPGATRVDFERAGLVR